MQSNVIKCIVRHATLFSSFLNDSEKMLNVVAILVFNQPPKILLCLFIYVIYQSTA